MKRFERSNGLDTALYKNYLYLFMMGIEWTEKMRTEEIRVWVGLANISQTIRELRLGWLGRERERQRNKQIRSN